VLCFAGVSRDRSRTAGARWPLEPDAPGLRRLARRCLRFALDEIEAAYRLPASDLKGAERLAGRPRAPVPERGWPLEACLDQVRRAARKSITTVGPGYLAYIPGGGLSSAVFAELIAYALNRFTNRWWAAPALAELEADALSWLMSEFRYPAGARGLLTTGGSMANLSAIVAAREALLGRNWSKGTLYYSDQTHHSIEKAARILGFPKGALRPIRSDAALRLDLAALGRALRRDRARGARPFLVVGNAGTVHTGAVDPIGELAGLARDQGLWLHIDGAYGGCFQLTDDGRRLYRGIARADSITLDPHKGLFLPYGTGCLLVRDGEALRRAHSFDADYLQDLHAPPGSISFADYSLELSREYRGLRLWLPLRLHGLAAFRAALKEKLELARWAHDTLTRTPGFECPFAPELSIVSFRYRPRRGDPEPFQQRLLERINAAGPIHISSTRVRGRIILRFCILSFRTHRRQVERAVKLVQRCARELAAGAT
jgi:aromatic-L-amino-acid decarboxylase